MRIPLSWLREFVPIEAEPDALAERLSLSSFAVDEIVRIGRGIAGVVVGEVRAMREHPNADTLMLVRLFDGAQEHDVVCGARNYEVGDRVPFARPGARLPNGMEIGRRVVRGEPSDGMLCSARELEIADDHAGIVLLDTDAPLGEDLVRALDLDDVVFDLDVTPNRPDALSVVGIAREVAALYGLPLTVPSSIVPQGPSDAGDFAAVEIEDAKGCPRYLARVIEDVSIHRSPWWMRRRILAAGMRPISNVVDVTNYVLLERGHPLHAFDLDALAGRAIVVRRPRRGERITTLDGQDRALDRNDVVICDAERPVALAGIMGGADTEVSEKTTRILLESAYFEPQRIAATARAVGLRSEASVRFERGTDPEGVPAAADRAAELLAALAGGIVARGSIDVYPKRITRKAVRLRVARANALLGIDRTAEQMNTSLQSLGCATELSRATIRVTPPTFRPDLSIEEDLVEEIARLVGYDALPETLPPGARTGALTPVQLRRRGVRSALLGAGLHEAQTLSLLPPSAADRLRAGAHHPFRGSYYLANPLSDDESMLRSSLVPGLLLAAQRNVARRVLPVRLFEIGAVFLPGDEAPHEVQRVGLVMTGPAPGGWHAPERPLDFFDGKGVVEALLEALGHGDATVEAYRPAPGDPEHPGRCAAVSLGGSPVGRIAELHPHLAEAFELPARVVFAELDLEPLLRAPSGGRTGVVPRFPAVSRDIALVVPDDVAAADVERLIRRAGGPMLEAPRIFDVYRGHPVPTGSVSLAFSLSLRAPERTLTDADADEVMGRIERAAGEAGWTVRD